MEWTREDEMRPTFTAEGSSFLIEQHDRRIILCYHSGWHTGRRTRSFQYPGDDFAELYTLYRGHGSEMLMTGSLEACKRAAERYRQSIAA